MHCKYDGYLLSIPVSWDFPLHPTDRGSLHLQSSTFNSRFLGFSFAPSLRHRHFKLGKHLSIPVSWDFPLHQRHYWNWIRIITDTFNSRFLGFSFAPNELYYRCRGSIEPFQFPFLGIFLCTLLPNRTVSALEDFFQFPFLGIFLCTRHGQSLRCSSVNLSFNSRFLGFSFAPQACM